MNNILNIKTGEGVTPPTPEKYKPSVTPENVTHKDTKFNEGDRIEFFELKKNNWTVNQSYLKRYLESKGYFNAITGTGIVLAKRENNLLKVVTLSDIQNDLINNGIKEITDIEELQTELENVFLKGLDSYLSKSKLNILKQIEAPIPRDTNDKAWLYFKNGFVSVTKNGIEFKNYAELPSPIWENQLLDRDFSLVDRDVAENSMYATFLKRISTDPKTGIIDNKRLKAIESSHAYLLHRYNDRAYPKCIVYLDSNIEDGEHGGTGKGIIKQAVSKLRNVTTIDGKTLNMSDRFALQQISHDTEIVYLEDTKKRFDFRNFFSSTTEGYKIERKNADKIEFDFEDNPKTAITTNYSIQNDSESSKRRLEFIELQNYYDTKRTPLKEFGKRLFDDFTASEWNEFDSCMIYCLLDYLNNDNRIPKYESETLKDKQLIVSIGRELYEYFEENVNAGNPFEVKSHAEKFKNETSSKISNTNFGKKFNTYIEAKGLKLEKTRNKERKTEYIPSGGVSDVLYDDVPF